ncbi:MAG: dephospho-CoA kinase [Planctomycetota bacterium]
MVATLFAEERSAVHLDADRVARRVLARPAVVKAVARKIPGAVGHDGKMDRQKLARKVFSSPQALAALEEIVHPPIRRAMERAIRRVRAPYVLVDAALLQESGADELCDVLLYVACPARTRRARARRHRGWSGEEHRAREARQWSCRRKRAGADLVVDNAGDKARTRREVRRVLRRLERRS